MSEVTIIDAEEEGGEDCPLFYLMPSAQCTLGQFFDAERACEESLRQTGPDQGELLIAGVVGGESAEAILDIIYCNMYAAVGGLQLRLMAGPREQGAKELPGPIMPVIHEVDDIYQNPVTLEFMIPNEDGCQFELFYHGMIKRSADHITSYDVSVAGAQSRWIQNNLVPRVLQEGARVEIDGALRIYRTIETNEISDIVVMDAAPDAPVIVYAVYRDRIEVVFEA